MWDIELRSPFSLNSDSFAWIQQRVRKGLCKRAVNEFASRSLWVWPSQLDPSVVPLWDARLTRTLKTEFLWVCVSCSVVSNSLRPCGLEPASLLCPWNSPGKNTGVGYQSRRSSKGAHPPLACRVVLDHTVFMLPLKGTSTDHLSRPRKVLWHQCLHLSTGKPGHTWHRAHSWKGNEPPCHMLSGQEAFLNHRYSWWQLCGNAGKCLLNPERNLPRATDALTGVMFMLLCFFENGGQFIRTVHWCSIRDTDGYEEGRVWVPKPAKISTPENQWVSSALGHFHSCHSMSSCISSNPNI